MIHIGSLIEQILHQQGRSVTWFATQLCCTRSNVYKIFNKQTIDTQLLWRISCILHYDFFYIFSEEIATEISYIKQKITDFSTNKR